MSELALAEKVPTLKFESWELWRSKFPVGNPSQGNTIEPKVDRRNVPVACTAPRKIFVLLGMNRLVLAEDETVTLPPKSLSPVAIKSPVPAARVVVPPAINCSIWMPFAVTEKFCPEVLPMEIPALVTIELKSPANIMPASDKDIPLLLIVTFPKGPARVTRPEKPLLVLLAIKSGVPPEPIVKKLWPPTTTAELAVIPPPEIKLKSLFVPLTVNELVISVSVREVELSK